MNLDKIREEIIDLLYDWELFRNMDLEDCKDAKMSLSFLGTYILNQGEDPIIGFFEVDIEELTNEIMAKK